MHSLAFVLALLSIARTDTAAAAATAAARRDTSVVSRAESGPADEREGRASVAFDFGSGTGTPVMVRAIEFSTTRAPGRDGDERAGALTRVTVVRTPDSLSAALARLVATGERLVAMDARLPGRDGAPALGLRLRDVRVSAARLVMSDDTLGLAQQRLALEESITQLTVDLAEARRQYGVAEQLERQRLSPSMELARVRGTVESLTKRLATQQERHAMVVQQLARWTPVREELVLEAAAAEVGVRR
jgi:hypothetical protein